MAFKFEKLAVWQLALEYVDVVYRIVDQLPRPEEYNLKSQIVRAATSIALNIAEGSTGQTNAEQARFLGMALRSLMETVACQELIKRRGYPVDVRLLQDAYGQAETLARKLQAMRKAVLPDRTWVREDPGGYSTGDAEAGTLDHPSSVTPRPSPLVRHPLSAAHGPSSSIDCPPSVVRRPSSVVHGLSSNYAVLGIIPARGGSKGIPRKNLALLCGKPLLQYTAEAALAATTLTRVILSTDDPEIAEVGRRCGLDVPFMRPQELGRDDTPTLPVVQHAVRFLEERGDFYDAICLLQPTNPLRRPEWIDACVRLLFERGADAVVTVLPVPHEYNPHWVYFQREDGTLYLSTGEQEPLPRRQLLPPAFHREGSVYVTRRDVLMERNSLYGESVLGYVLDPEETVNVDGPEDVARAEVLLAERERSGGL